MENGNGVQRFSQKQQVFEEHNMLVKTKENLISRQEPFLANFVNTNSIPGINGTPPPHSLKLLGKIVLSHRLWTSASGSSEFRHWEIRTTNSWYSKKAICLWLLYRFTLWLWVHLQCTELAALDTRKSRMVTTCGILINICFMAVWYKNDVHVTRSMVVSPDAGWYNTWKSNNSMEDNLESLLERG